MYNGASLSNENDKPIRGSEIVNHLWRTRKIESPMEDLKIFLCKMLCNLYLNGQVFFIQAGFVTPLLSSLDKICVLTRDIILGQERVKD